MDDELETVLDSEPMTGTLKLEDDGSLVYTPTLDFNGVITFTYHASDGLADSNTAVVTMTMTAENDGPLAAADGYTTKEDEPLNVAADGVLCVTRWMENLDGYNLFLLGRLNNITFFNKM